MTVNSFLFRVTIVFFFLVNIAGTSLAQIPKENAGVVMQATGGIASELADDLTEVLISELVQKSGGKLRFMGKEKLQAILMEKRTSTGSPCLTSIQCIRHTAKQLGFTFMISGEIGKARGGFRLVVRKLSLTGIPDRMPYRKIVIGDIAKLIEEVEQLSDWLLKPEDPYMVIKVKPAVGVNLTLDGRRVQAYTVNKPFRVEPGHHEIILSKSGYHDFKTKVECKQGHLCEVSATLAPAPPPVKVTGKPKLGVKTGKQIGPEVVESVEERDDRPALKAAAWVLTGVALLSIGGGIYSGMKVLQYQDEFDSEEKKATQDGVISPTEHNKLQSLLNDGDNSALIANILFGLGGAAVIGAGICFYYGYATSKKSDEASKFQILPLVTDNYGGLSISISF